MDRLAAEFERQGYPTVRQHLVRDGRMGRMVRRGDAEICFGIEDDDETVCVTDYRRLDARTGMRQGFAELIWFVEFIVARPELHLRRLRGLVRPSKIAGAIARDRLAAGYRLLGGRHECLENGEEWLALEFSDYRSIHRAHRPVASEVAVHG